MKYGKSFLYIKNIAICYVFFQIAFYSSNSRILLIAIFTISILNDFFRKRKLKSSNFFVVSMIFSILIGAILKYSFGNIANIYMYISLVEILFWKKTIIPFLLISVHGTCFLFIDLILYFLNTKNGGAFLLYDVFDYILGFCILMLIREQIRQREKFEELNGELLLKNQLLEKQRHQLEELAVMKDRNRMAQDLHDSLGHTLMAINMHLKVLEKQDKNTDEKVQQIMKSLNEIVQSGIVQLRDTVYRLKNKTATRSLKEELDKIVEKIRVDDSIIVQVDFDENVEEEPEVEDVIFKSVRECLTNTVRHAQASLIQIKIYKEEGRINIEVSDNGKGSEEVNKSYGLQGIENRIKKLGGSVSFISELGKGFIFRADIPIIVEKIK